MERKRETNLIGLLYYFCLKAITFKMISNGGIKLFQNKLPHRTRCPKKQVHGYIVQYRLLKEFEIKAQ